MVNNMRLIILLLCPAIMEALAWNADTWNAIITGTTGGPWKRDKTNIVKQAIIDAHNRCRSDVIPEANPPLQPLEWDDDLEFWARKWAGKQTCAYPHNHQDEEDMGGVRCSENLAAGLSLDVYEYETEQQLIDLAVEAVEDWCEQQQYYDWETQNCNPSSKKCKHFTTLAWDKSTKLGCSFKVCGPALYGHRPIGYNLVCEYYPRGAYLGCHPYNRIEGEPCTDSAMCVDGATSEQMLEDGYTMQYRIDACHPEDNPWCRTIYTTWKDTRNNNNNTVGQSGKSYCTYWSGLDISARSDDTK